MANPKLFVSAKYRAPTPPLIYFLTIFTINGCLPSPLRISVSVAGRQPMGAHPSLPKANRETVIGPPEGHVSRRAAATAIYRSRGPTDFLMKRTHPAGSAHAPA